MEIIQLANEYCSFRRHCWSQRKTDSRAAAKRPSSVSLTIALHQWTNSPIPHSNLVKESAKHQWYRHLMAFVFSMEIKSCAGRVRRKINNETTTTTRREESHTTSRKKQRLLLTVLLCSCLPSVTRDGAAPNIRFDWCCCLCGSCCCCCCFACCC